jgi:DNA-binding NtrC family response regulator
LPETEEYSNGWVPTGKTSPKSKSKEENIPVQKSEDISLPAEKATVEEPTDTNILSKKHFSLEEEVAAMEKKLILEALQRTGGVRMKAAKLLNISRRMLAYKMEKLGINL